METKKIIGIVSGIVLVLVFVFTLTWGIINFNKVKAGISGTELYTKQDIDNSYTDGYTTAMDNKAEYEGIITEYREKLTEFENIKKELTVSKLKTAELENKVAYLNNYIAECEQLIKTMTAENHNLKAQIKTLEEIRANLIQSVNAYVQLISSISLINERFVVTFMFDDTVYSILLVPDGEKVELVNPTSTEYTIFLGWSLSQDGELIDLENLEISADTVLYAKIIRKYDVNFIMDYAVYEHHIVERGSTITADTPASTERRVFKGWSLDGVNILNVTNYAMTEHRTFFAVVEQRYEVKFVYTRKGASTTISTQYVGALSRVTVPAAPTFQGYSFSGWLLNGLTASDPTVFIATSDTVFAARYTPLTATASRPFRFGINPGNSFAQYSILQYLSQSGYGYITNMNMLTNWALTIRVYSGRINGHTMTITPNTSSYPRLVTASFNETLAKGQTFVTWAFSGQFIQVQTYYEGFSLLSNINWGASIEIVSFQFTLVNL